MMIRSDIEQILKAMIRGSGDAMLVARMALDLAEKAERETKAEELPANVIPFRPQGGAS